MHPIRAIGHAARVLAGLAAAVLALAAPVPAVLASTSPRRARLLSWADPPLPPGWNKHPPLPAHVHALATGGLPGWQIALIAAAAVFAAAVVGLLARARAARRRAAASPA
jgi:hypothetical protein